MGKLKEILIIDDNEATNHFHRRLIEKLYPEIQVHLTKNGKAGFDYFVNAEEKPVLIFLDLNMPVMDGFEFLGVLNAYLPTEEQHKTSIVILSSSDENLDKERTRSLYPNISFNPKPLSKDKLSKIIDPYNKD
ncbi:MAG: response regulator [Fluviicola sp.]|nr:MAG: response regulator [Fluviicola sp.]